MSMIENLEAMLARGQDNALLRFSLGGALLKEGAAYKAAEHLKRAVEHDPNYSAAWKLYGKALAEAGRPAEAMQAYESGIRIAEAKGDIQAAKEMRVFLKRLKAAG
jgi:predicted Zn-dependent protease